MFRLASTTTTAAAAAATAATAAATTALVRTMAGLSFADAKAAVGTLDTRPDNSTLLKLYALYKQGTDGPCTTEQPSMLQMVARAKWDAWADLGSQMSKEQAQEQYIALVESLVGESQAAAGAAGADGAAAGAAGADGGFEGEFVRASVDAGTGVAHVELTSVTMPPGLFGEVGAAFRGLAGAPGVSAVVLSGAAGSKAFSYGLDLGRTMGEVGHVLTKTDGASKAALFAMIREWQADLSAVAALPVPVVAAVHSYCIGGGVDLIAAADVRLASRDAVFSVREADLGITADLGSLQRLPGIIGQGHTRHLALSACDIDASTAAAMGLVAPSLAQDADAVLADAFALAEKMASNPRSALVGTKSVLNHAIDADMDRELNHVALYNTAHLDFDVVAAVYAQKMADRGKQ